MTKYVWCPVCRDRVVTDNHISPYCALCTADWVLWEEEAVPDTA